MVMYREVCPEGVQNKCPGEVWCRGFMSWGDTLILVISRGVQLYYGIAHTLLAQLTQCVALLGLQYVYQMCTTISPVFSSELREDIRHLTQTQSFIVITITGTNNNLY